MHQDTYQQQTCGADEERRRELCLGLRVISSPPRVEPVQQDAAEEEDHQRNEKQDPAQLMAMIARESRSGFWFCLGAHVEKAAGFGGQR